MNTELQNFARKEILAGLQLLPDSWNMTFKRMYSHKNLDADINDVIDNIPEEKLDWAMQQVQRSIDKLKSNPTAENRKG